MGTSRQFTLGLIWAVGIATIVGSQLQEDKPPPAPPVPVTVQYDLTADSLARDVGVRTSEVSDVLLSGNYSANQGNTLTLDRDSVVLDTSSKFTITITESSDDLPVDSASLIEVADGIDLGLANPESGRFTSLFSGTTTSVTFTASGVDVLIEQPDATTDQYSLTEFESAEDDNDATVDLRMASAAYNMFNVVLRTAILMEDIIDDIEANKTTLEAMGTGSPLTLSCDNTTTSGVTHTLEWRTDATDSGQGTIGALDAFEVVYTNCENRSRGYFLRGTIPLNRYNPADEGVLSTLGIHADLSLLYISDTDNPTTPGSDSPRLNGELSLIYSEQAITRQPVE